nr:MAG TPA: hypothetical protein [Caudoviricetes sp.]
MFKLIRYYHVVYHTAKIRLNIVLSNKKRHFTTFLHYLTIL